MKRRWTAHSEGSRPRPRRSRWICRGRGRASHAGADAAGAAGKTLDEVEREHILAALARNGGNRTATAAELGISRRTLYYKLEGYQKLGFAVE